VFSCEVNYSGKRQLCYLLWYIFIHVIYLIARGRRGRDHMVVGFTANRGNNKITESLNLLTVMKAGGLAT
jgi:hypothetical protein